MTLLLMKSNLPKFEAPPGYYAPPYNGLPPSIQSVSTMQIRMLLGENKKNLLQAFTDLQDGGNLAQTVGALEVMHNNLSYLCQAADY